jgi:probable aminopeptidase NPEPL1
MGGSAAVLGAFQAYVQTSKTRKADVKLHALLCLADNAVGPLSYRNDDVLNMYSGKTVEINNTDAEGRLVLGDGVAYATKDLNADVVIDVATLTGAALVNTGIRHAGVVSNDETAERAMIAAGKTVGTLCYPMIYAPEVLFDKMFSSRVADMKNSVKSRMNAQSSCAGHFIESHLVGKKWDWRVGYGLAEGVEKKGIWVHVDCAGTASDEDEMGTGFGPALLCEFTRGL